MQIQYNIEMSEIEHCPELSRYNHTVWKFKHPSLIKCTHFHEMHDDVSSSAEYIFGNYEKNGEFTNHSGGIGNSVNIDYLGYSGIWINVWVHWILDGIESY